MTEKEKAEELVKKFEPHARYWDCYNDSKSCALLCVNEIINLGLLSLKETKNGFLQDTTKPYWENVKKEIELL